MQCPDHSVRGRIRRYIQRQAYRLGDNVLEIGSRIPSAGAWWAVNRDLAKGNWLGMDVQAGEGVDAVADLHALPADWTGRFSGVLCSEVLEHIARPWLALPEIHRVMQAGGWLIVTTLFAFPEHGYPDDYYRYSRQGLTLLLQDAGFDAISVEYDGIFKLCLNDHGEKADSLHSIPMHIFAVAQCCK